MIKTRLKVATNVRKHRLFGKVVMAKAVKFVIQGDLMIKTRLNMATKARKHRLFGKVVMAKAGIEEFMKDELRGPNLSGKFDGDSIGDAIEGKSYELKQFFVGDSIGGSIVVKTRQEKSTKAEKHRLFGKVVIVKAGSP